MSNAIITLQGLQKIAAFDSTHVPVNITHIAVGDGGGSGYNPTGQETALALVALNDTTHWQRTSPFLNAAATALGLTSEQLDDLFIQASGIEL